MTSRTQGLLAINLAAVIFGSAALYGKLDVSPVWIVAARAAFASAAVAAFGFVTSQIAWPKKEHVVPLLVTGILLSGHWLSFFIAVQQAGIAIATLTFAVFPLFTVSIDTLRTGRRFRPLELVSGVAIVVAVGMLVEFDAEKPNEMMGAAAGLVSAATFAVFGIISKALTRALRPVQVSLFQNLVVVASLAPVLGIAQPIPHKPSDWLWLSLLGVVTTALMHQLYLYALQRLAASTCSGFVALEPVYAVVFAALLFHDPVTIWVFVSAGLVVGASVLLLRQESTTSTTMFTANSK